MAETGDLKSFQCRFESDRGYHGLPVVDDAQETVPSALLLEPLYAAEGAIGL